ncbi:MAG: PfkB family carbohydrate kinase, partial [Ignavibacteria bacterium]
YLNIRIENYLFDYLRSIVNDLDGIILQDYNKGVLTKSFVIKILELAKQNDKLITVDPKFENFFNYKNVTVFKPNRKEAEQILGMKITTAKDVTFAGNKILEKLEANYVLLTLGEEGMAVFEKGKDEVRLSTRARKTADVSGAGDTVISTLTMSLAAGADIIEASYIANYAGGLVCEEVGIVPIELEKLFETLLNQNK